MIRTQEGFVLYVCIKFEADSSIRAKLIRVPKFRNWAHTQERFIWSRLPMGHFEVYMQECRNGPSSIFIPNLKQIDHFIQSGEFRISGGGGNFPPATCL